MSNKWISMLHKVNIGTLKDTGQSPNAGCFSNPHLDVKGFQKNLFQMYTLNEYMNWKLQSIKKTVVLLFYITAYTESGQFLSNFW